MASDDEGSCVFQVLKIFDDKLLRSFFGLDNLNIVPSCCLSILLVD